MWKRTAGNIGSMVSRLSGAGRKQDGRQWQRQGGVVWHSFGSAGWVVLQGRVHAV